MAAYYPANVIATSLASAVDSTTTDIPVADGLTYPDPTTVGRAPYKVIVGFSTSREEICLVTAKPTANTLRVTRGYDSSPATAKNAGDVVVPGVSSADFTTFAAMVPLTGGTMTGPLVLPGSPTADLESATKKYVDDTTVSVSGDAMTGPLLLSGAPTAALAATTKNYVDTAALPIGGGTLTGPLVLPGVPTVAGQAATKGYVDTAALPIGGGTLTGPLTLSGPPTAALHAATRQYVDDLALGNRVGDWTPAAGLDDWGGAYSGLYCTTAANMIGLVEGRVSPISAIALTAGSPITLGTVPATFRPAHTKYDNWGVFWASNVGPAKALMVSLDTAGTLTLYPTVTESWAATGWVSINLVFRLA